MRAWRFGAVLLLAAIGCGQGGEKADTTVSVATSATDRAVTAAAVANAIAANPSAADSILQAAGYTPAGFQELMYDIAADSAMSAAYAAARAR